MSISFLATNKKRRYLKESKKKIKESIIKVKKMEDNIKAR